MFYYGTSQKSHNINCKKKKKEKNIDLYQKVTSRVIFDSSILLLIGDEMIGAELLRCRLPFFKYCRFVLQWFIKSMEIKK